MNTRIYRRSHQEQAERHVSRRQPEGDYVKNERDASQRQLRHPHAPRRDVQHVRHPSLQSTPTPKPMLQ